MKFLESTTANISISLLLGPEFRSKQTVVEYTTLGKVYDEVLGKEDVDHK